TRSRTSLTTKTCKPQIDLTGGRTPCHLLLVPGQMTPRLVAASRPSAAAPFPLCHPVGQHVPLPLPHPPLPTDPRLRQMRRPSLEPRALTDYHPPTS
ncbi:MAG TPA: hypothetical protein VIO35_08490, partial [Chloroflexota bacterium]